MATNIASSIKINDFDVPYELVWRKVKNPRLEFRNGSLKLVVPNGFKEHEKLLNKHKSLIFQRFIAYKQRHLFSSEIELHSARTKVQFQEYVDFLISYIGTELGVFPKKVTFRKMRTKWGSCSSKGNISLNTYLIFLPERLVDYVVFHEMVHLIEMNHGPRFKEIVRNRFHEHRILEKQLREYWPVIMDKYSIQ
jgi:predicted metal-dependent hydrolase